MFTSYSCLCVPSRATSLAVNDEKEYLVSPDTIAPKKAQKLYNILAPKKEQKLKAFSG